MDRNKTKEIYMYFVSEKAHFLAITIIEAEILLPLRSG